MKKEKVVERIVKDKKRRRVAFFTVVLLVAVLGLVFVISAFQEGLGAFTINLAYKDAGRGLVLYDNRGFKDGSGRLTAEPLRGELTNITSADLFDDMYYGSNLVDGIDGSHHKLDSTGYTEYFAYTFFIRNNWDKAQYYTGAINLLNSAKGVDEAVRFMVISDRTTYSPQGDDKYDKFNRQFLIYGKEKAGGGNEEDVNINFLAERGMIIDFGNRALEKEETHKFTIIMYLEGNDFECNNDIKGGMVQFDMTFEVGDDFKPIVE